MARSNSTRSGRRSQRTGQRLLGGIEMDHEIDEIGVAGRGERSGRNSDLRGARGRPGQRLDIGAGRSQPATDRGRRATQRGGLGAGLNPRPQSSRSRGRATSDFEGLLDSGGGANVRSPSGTRGARGALTISGNRAEITMNDEDQREPMQRTRRSGLSANQLMNDEDAFNRANEGGATFEPDNENAEMEGERSGRTSARGGSRARSSSRSNARSGSTARRSSPKSAASRGGSRSSAAGRRGGPSGASRAGGSSSSRPSGSSRAGSRRAGTSARTPTSRASGSRKKASRSSGTSRPRGSATARGGARSSASGASTRAGGGRSRSASSTSRGRSSGTGASRSTGSRKTSKRSGARGGGSPRTSTSRRTAGSRGSSRR